MPVGSQGVQKIDRGENACANRNLFALQAVGIAGAIPLFVVGPHDRHHRIREAHALQNLRPHHGVDFHLFEFFRRQPSRLRDDVLGHGEFADIVQQRRGLQRFHLRRSYAQFLGDFDGIDPHPLQVVMGGVVLGLDGQRQSFNGAHVQSRHLFDVALFVFQFSQVQPVRAVDQVHHGHGEKRRFPSERAVEPADHAGDGGAHQVIGERPE